MIRLRITYTLSLLLLTVVCQCKNLFFNHIDIDNEQSQSSAISIWQDELGGIWFGNSFLNLYADNVLKTFHVSDYLDGIEDRNIHGICGGSELKLYFLADNRLVSYDIRQEKFTDTKIDAKSICYYKEQLYYAQNNKLFLYNEKNKQSSELLVLPDSASKINYVLFKEASCWLATENGVYEYKQQKVSRILNGINASCLFVDSAGNLWVGTSQSGASLLDRKTGKWTWFHEKDNQHSVVHNRIRCISEDNRGNIWVGTYKGLSLIDSSHQQVNHIRYDCNSPYSLSHSSVYSIYKDRQGGMWIGTYYGGLDYLNPNAEDYYYFATNPGIENSLNGFILNNMTEDTKGNVYIGTEEGGVNILNKSTMQIKQLKDPTGQFQFHTVKDVWFDVEYNRLIIGTFMEGLIIYDVNTQLFKRINSPLLTQKSHSIISGLTPWGNDLLILTQGGLFKLDRKELVLSNLLPEKVVAEVNNSVMQTMYLSGNRLWIASASAGIFYIDLHTNKVVYPKEINEISKHGTVNSICEDRLGRLYLVILNKGIVRYNPQNKEIVHYRQETGDLLTNRYFKTVCSTSGKLIASFANGVTLFDTETGKINHIQFGIQSSRYLLTPNCGIYLSPYTNDLFIGGVKGLLVLRIEDLYTGIRPYSIWFSSLAVNNELVTPVAQPNLLKSAIAYVDTLNIPYDQNNLSFVFASSNYCQRNSFYEYKLEGHDRQWTPSKHQSITYTALPPGNYRLIVRETGNYGKQIQLHIIVHPPFYASVWAYILYAAVFILIIVWIIRFNRSRAALRVSLEMEHRDKLCMEEMNQMKLRFFTNISHELRTPLTLISSQLDVAIRGNVLSTSLKKALQRAYNQSLYMQDLISEIVNFRRMDQEALPLQVGYSNITSFLNEMFLIFKEYAKEREVDYRLDSSEEDIYIWFDTVQMKKVFYNLLSNAFKFTPCGGCVKLQLIRQKDIVQITISDTGSGIPPEQRERIFERFYQIDRQCATTEGSGIGLALTRTIILQHKGSICVTDNEGGGSCFTIVLPTDAPFSDKERKKSSTPLVLHGENGQEKLVESLANASQKPSVLLVEDNQELLTVLEEAFSPIYRVYKASNGKEGVEVATAVVPDLIVSDVMMPLLSGTELCIQLKNKLETSHIPILLLTAQAMPEQMIKGLTEGADDYITKPFNIQVLLLKCNSFIRNRQKLLEHFQSAAAPMFESVRELATNRLDQSLLERSIAFIEANLQNEVFDIDLWCSEMAVSRSKLNNKIKAISGLTLNDFIMQVKLNRSCKLLISAPELTIAEIAYQCGFTSSSYFGKCFKARYNISPKDYRSKG